MDEKPRHGKWGGSSLTLATGVDGSSQKWDLDIRGNWRQFVRDLNGNGTYTDGRNLVPIPPILAT
jgi:hypothetical protein